MAVRTAEEIRASFEGDPHRAAAFAEHVTLVELFSASIVTPEYHAAAGVVDALTPTKDGMKVLAWLVGRLPGASNADAMLALWLSHAHRDILFDYGGCDLDYMRQMMSADVIAQRVRYPYVYGRLLYDRFFRQHGRPAQELSYEDVLQLIDGLPQGVFQLRDTVVGPFGLLRSEAQRFAPPSPVVPLWHCKDYPDCQACHSVRLNSGEHVISDLAALLTGELLRRFGRADEWTGAYRRYLGGLPDRFDDMALHGVAGLLGDGFGDVELRRLLSEAIRTEPTIKTATQAAECQAVDWRRSPEAIALAVGAAEALQLLLVLTDEKLVSLIERLMDSGDIQVPALEVRKARCAAGPLGPYDTSVECSALGVRSAPVGADLALRRLRRLVLALDGGRERRLEHRLRFTSGASIGLRLESYLSVADPKVIVADAVADADGYDTTVAVLRYGRFVPATSPEDESRLVDRCLWKLGFDQSVDLDVDAPFDAILDAFESKARLVEGPGGHSSLRSTAVNVFVRFEDLLDRAVSFGYWSMLSDHYAETHHRFNLDSGRLVAARWLGERKIGGALYSVRGQNVLAVLIGGLTELGNKCESLLADPDAYLRPRSAWPEYVGHTDLEWFPYRHTVAALDCNADEVRSYVVRVREVVGELDRAKVANVRNRYDHHRPAAEFPTREEASATAAALRRCRESLCEIGALPTFFRRVRDEVDEYGRRRVIMRDAKARDVLLVRPLVNGPARLLDLRPVQLIIPAMHLADTTEPLRFDFEATSSYQKMWESWPRPIERSGLGGETDAVSANLDANDE